MVRPGRFGPGNAYVMYRFANRSACFVHAYQLGLDGAQASWATKKYHGHHMLPNSVMEALDSSN